MSIKTNYVVVNAFIRNSVKINSINILSLSTTVDFESYVTSQLIENIVTQYFDRDIKVYLDTFGWFIGKPTKQEELDKIRSYYFLDMSCLISTLICKLQQNSLPKVKVESFFPDYKLLYEDDIISEYPLYKDIDNDLIKTDILNILNNLDAKLNYSNINYNKFLDRFNPLVKSYIVRNSYMINSLFIQGVICAHLSKEEYDENKFNLS